MFWVVLNSLCPAFQNSADREVGQVSTREKPRTLFRVPWELTGMQVGCYDVLNGVSVAHSLPDIGANCKHCVSDLL